VADDLIPPPSPAGRPPADPTAALGTGAAPAPAAPPPEEPAPPRASPYRSRFGFVFGALAGVAACAVVLAVVLANGSSDSAPRLAANWSDWQPGNTEMLAGAESIAEHVAGRYRLDDGDQLVGVRSSGLELQGVPLSVAVRPTGGEVEFLEGDGLMYVLDGLGPNGTLARGKPSRARGRLLRREALELALYSFRYLDDASMVAVMMPPIPQKEGEGDSEQPQLQQQALFFRPGDLLPQLQVPLTDTLASQTVSPKRITPQESSRIDSLTLGNLFIADFQQAQDATAYLLLQEPDGIE
jgi:hypothetical protein